MNISCEEHRSAVVLTLKGECTFDDVDSMRRSIQPFLERPGLSLVVDGCGLERIDSTGLESLLQLSEDIRATGGRLCLAGFSGDARTALVLTRLDRRFELRETIEEAARAVSLGEAA